MQSFKLAHITQNLELIALYKVIYKYKQKICSFGNQIVKYTGCKKNQQKAVFFIIQRI